MVNTAHPDMGDVQKPATQYTGTYTLEVTPDKAREAQKLFQNQVDLLKPVIIAGRSALRIEPWLGDPVSEKTAARMTEMLLTEPASAQKRFEQLLNRLENLADQCGQMADDFERTEDTNHRAMGRIG